MFISFHCFTKYVKAAFFRCAWLRPVPPGASRHRHLRDLDIYEGELDEAQFADWMRRRADCPASGCEREVRALTGETQDRAAERNTPLQGRV